MAAEERSAGRGDEPGGSEEQDSASSPSSAQAQLDEAHPGSLGVCYWTFSEYSPRDIHPRRRYLFSLRGGEDCDTRLGAAKVGPIVVSLGVGVGKRRQHI